MAFSVASGKLVTNIAAGNILAAFGPYETKLYLMWALGIFWVALQQQNYAALPPRPIRQFRGWSVGIYSVAAAVMLFSYLFGVASLEFACGLGVATFLLHLASTFARGICRIRWGQRSWWGTQVLVVGSNLRAQTAMRTFLREPQWGVRPIGFISEESNDPDIVDHPWNLGPMEDLEQLAREHGVTRAVVALHELDQETLNLNFVDRNSAIEQWFLLPSSGRTPSLWTDVNQVARMPALTFSNNLSNPVNRGIKRLLDVLISGACLVLLSPVFLVITVAIRLTSPGPIFYRDPRMGQGSKKFHAFKFRTMLVNGDEVLRKCLAENPEMKVEWEENTKLKRDPRITGIGRLLRTTSLDELPQLWNVLTGEMSLVGPRPIHEFDVRKYGDDYQFYANATPGITGLWQVSGRNNVSFPERIAMDCYYVENWSVWLDLYILACTVRVVLRREGAY